MRSLSAFLPPPLTCRPQSVALLEEDDSCSPCRDVSRNNIQFVRAVDLPNLPALTYLYESLFTCCWSIILCLFVPSDNSTLMTSLILRQEHFRTCHHWRHCKINTMSLLSLLCVVMQIMYVLTLSTLDGSMLLICSYNRRSSIVSCGIIHNV